VSAAISFLRSFVFQIAAVIVFPLIWGIDGIWVSVVFAELAGMLVGIAFWIAKRKKYQYW
ncbi:MAG: MATE family efflux transporter, partial [Oscillospiraceae bacterium]|nr:MATE family efflux transporter [Oscillospiraceae bacterium]